MGKGLDVLPRTTQARAGSPNGPAATLRVIGANIAV